MRREGGSVSIVAAGVMTLAIVLSMGAADLARVVVAKTRAQTAADAAALAAAQELALPSGLEPVDVAREYASRTEGELASCTCAPGTTEAIVDVLEPVGALFLLGDDRWVDARARAVVDPPST